MSKFRSQSPAQNQGRDGSRDHHGAAFVELNFFGLSPRSTTPDNAAQLAALVPPRIKTAAVTVAPDDALLNDILARSRLYPVASNDGASVTATLTQQSDAKRKLLTAATANCVRARVARYVNSR
jgi:phosphoribosylanthranilate isomerase